MSLENDRMSATDDPYRIPESSVSRAKERPPLRERLAVGVIFLAFSYLFLLMLSQAVMKILTMQGVLFMPGLLRMAWGSILEALLLASLPFSAGFMLLLRRRRAVEMFVLAIVVQLSHFLLYTVILEHDWRPEGLMFPGFIAVCALYAAVLRRRGRLR